MALLDEIKGEILQKKEQAPVQKQAVKPKSEKKPKTKAEIEAYKQKMQAREEAKYLKQMGQAPKAAKPRPKPKPKRQAAQTGEAAKPAQVSKMAKPKAKPKQESSCTKYRPRTVMTLDLPDGGSLMITYIRGAQ